MGDERTVPALVSVYKAEVWRHLGFCGNVRPWTAGCHIGSAACRVPCEEPSRGVRRAAGSLRGCSFLSCRGHSCQVRVLYPTLGFFFCKVVGKNPWSRAAFFWAYFTKYGCLLGKSDKQLRFFIYVRRILQYID